MNTVQQRYVEQDRRKSAVARILRHAKWEGEDRRRVTAYCEIAYRKGHINGRAAKQKSARKALASQISKLTYKYFSILADIAIPCPICSSVTEPGILHEHGTKERP